tara:strand:- start:578 stop:751 length:174 start_codon:yes stop_codon:yes gene_type:complete
LAAAVVLVVDLVEVEVPVVIELVQLLFQDHRLQLLQLELVVMVGLTHPVTLELSLLL